MQIAKDCLANIDRLRQLQQTIEAQAEGVLEELGELGYYIVTHDDTIDEQAAVRISKDAKSWTPFAASSYKEALCNAAAWAWGRK